MREIHQLGLIGQIPARRRDAVRLLSSALVQPDEPRIDQPASE